MSKKSEHTIVYTFQSLEDPLVKGLMLQYLTALTKRNDFKFHLITHEQPSFELSEVEMNKRKAELAALNIFWYPIKYHNGKWLLLKKLYDFLKSFVICTSIKWKYNSEFIIGFLPIAAGYSAIMAPILRLKLITYCFEPHSEYMADFGIWNRKSAKYVFLKKYEREQLEISTAIIIPTKYSADLVEKINYRAKKFVLPISIDTKVNIFDSISRKDIRDKFSISQKQVLLYMGKFGGIYYSISHMVDFFYRMKDLGNYHLMIISSEKSAVMNYIQSKNYDASFFTLIDFLPYNEIHKYISSADLGIIAVPPFPSQKFRTPVKTGLYLACGLPYLVNKGIAEDDLLAIEEKVGVVIPEFAEIHISEMHLQIQNILSEGESLKARCASVVEKFRSHDLAVEILEKLLSKK